MVRRIAPLLVAFGCTPGHPASGLAWMPTTSSEGSTSTSGVSSSTEATSGEMVDSSDEGEGGTTTGDPPTVPQPTRYPSDRVHSPLTVTITQRLIELRDLGPELADDVFMKAGASSDVSMSNLHCFAHGPVELGDYDALVDTLAFFLGGEALDTTPFDRESFATEVGRTATWANLGEPSPLVAEILAIEPAFAFVHFGTNDMEQASTPGAALPGFFAAMSTLLDELTLRGIVPIIVGLTRRGDDPEADLWIPTYNSVLRGMAQARQVPFVDAHLALAPLANAGLGPDGLHPESYSGGACILDELGLQHGYNMRNLIQLQALARIDGALNDAFAPDIEALPALDGDGTLRTPWQIDTLPFIHDADTHLGQREFDRYACDDIDESGPELIYELTLEVDTPLRVIALDREGVDVDVHVISAGDPELCIARGNTVVAGTVPAGAWQIAVDSWSDGTLEYPGAYLLTVVPCDEVDPDCAQ